MFLYTVIKKVWSKIPTNEEMFERVIEQFTLDEFIVDSLTPNVNKTKLWVFVDTQKVAVRRIDIRFIDKERLACAMLYFTGSGEFNMKMRSHALKKGIRLMNMPLKTKKQAKRYWY